MAKLEGEDDGRRKDKVFGQGVFVSTPIPNDGDCQ
jgi:hypothetical protein